MLQDAVCAVKAWRGRGATVVSQDTIPSQTARHVAVMVLVWLTVGAVQVASAFAFPTMGDGSVMYVHPATMDTQIVQSANVQGKAHMATSVTNCRVSACVSQGWWASNVTAVPLDSGSPSAQPLLVVVTQQALRWLIHKRAPVSAYQTWREACVTGVNLSTGIWQQATLVGVQIVSVI